MRSMRARLLLALVAVVVMLSSGWLLCAAWLTVRANTRQADDALRSSAELILWYLPDKVDTAYPLPSTRDNPMPAQVWGDRRLVSRTPDAPATPMKSSFAEGFANVRVDHRYLRVYAVSRGDGRLQVQVGRSLDQWEADIWRAVAFAAANVAGLLVLVGTTVWWITHWSFRPVTAIGAALRQRRELDLSALPTSALPDEIRPLVVSFNELLDRLRRSVEAERRFIADAAHELRTPLAALSAQAHVALHATQANEREEALQRLTAGVNRCSRLTGQLLELARLDAAPGTAQHDPIDLSKLVEIVLRDFEGVARQKDQRLCAQLEPCLVRGDIDEIGILVRNLVDNALRFATAGGRVVVSCGIVPFEGLPRAGLSVSDNGPGVRGPERTQVFERFYRVAGTGQSGSGIGLSLVKRIAERHGAQVRMTDGLDGRGVCVSVHFQPCDRRVDGP